MYVTNPNNSIPFTQHIADINYKKEFIQEVYDFMNDLS